MKKAIIKNTICILATIAVMMVVLSLVSHFVENKSTEAVSKYYHSYEKNLFDVVFLGPSAMKCGVYPLQLFDEYGIASYNLSSGNQTIPVSYYLAKEIIREQHPKVLVLEVSFIVYDQKYYLDECLHYVTDMMCTKEKLELIADMVPKDKAIEHLFNIVIYHDRLWEAIEDCVAGKNGEERVLYGSKVVTESKPISYEINENGETINSTTLEYLNKIIDLCKEEDIELLLVNLPKDFSSTMAWVDLSKTNHMYNELEQIAIDNEICYLNFMNLPGDCDIDLDYDTDGWLHLNVYGAEKMTSYIGAYIIDKYNVPNRKNEEKYAFMINDYAAFSKIIKESKVSMDKSVGTN